LPAGAAADGSGSSYCGAGLVVSAKRLVAGQPASLAVDPAMNPCASSSSSRVSTLPADEVKAQPAPAAALSAATVAQLATLGGSAGASLSVTLWGSSPYNETAGLATTSYPALPALSDVRAATVAALVRAKALNGKRRAVDGKRASRHLCNRSMG
jgi:hypothetical protein